MGQVRQEEVEEPEHVAQVYEQAEYLLKENFLRLTTHAGRNVVVELARVTRAGPTGQGSLATSRTGQTVTRRGLTGRANLGAGWGGLRHGYFCLLPAQVAKLLSYYPALQGHAPLVKVL